MTQNAYTIRHYRGTVKRDVVHHDHPVVTLFSQSCAGYIRSELIHVLYDMQKRLRNKCKICVQLIN